MDAKKISFGFSKVAKKPNILPPKGPKEENKVELIKCLEGKEIKLVAEKQEAAPLVIQMPSNQKTSTALASLMKRRAVLLGEDEPDPEETTAEPQSIAEVTDNLEQRAARELLAAARANGDEAVQGEKLVLPALKADELPLDGAKEATMDDYESIPIQQFGLAMLRGMGWVDPPPVSKKKGALVDEAPFLRPKGMGLGADKALKPKTLLVQPEQNEVLEIKKQAYVRILGGKQKDQYGQIEGFDDHAGRVIVKMAIGGAKEAFNEFLCQPVSRKEYAQYGKCINTAKYEEFKKHENEHGQIVVKREKSTERNNKKSEHRERHRDDERRSHRSRDEDRKPYKAEPRSIKTEERRVESRDYRDEHSSSSTSRHEERKPYKTEDRRRDDYSSSSSSRHQDTLSSRQEERKPYKTEERRREDYSSSSRYNERNQDSLSSKASSRRQQSSSDEADDTGESTESDSDSAYERKKNKKSKGSGSKRKKSKKGKSKSHRHRRSTESDGSDSCTDGRSRHSHQSKHKKKTKKSKHARSRTRSRSRSRSREGRGR
ncbi:hypothetical protein KR222_006867 [Zaprionus bogoriensis]|nr:hypothetical protein KR222_006867 [Zaprionus bogoriensis]